MTILFVGGEMGGFIPATAGAYETIGASGWDTAFARCASFVVGPTDYAESADFGTGTSLYCHFDLKVGDVSVGSVENARFRWCNGSGTEVVQLVQVNSTNLLRLEYWNGSAFVSAGSITVDMRTRQTIDIAAVVNSASGSLKLYLSGTKRIDSGTIDLSGITSLGKVRFYGPDPSGAGTFYTQCIVADEPTIGGRLFTVPVTGAGASTDWTGAHTEIDEIVYQDADFINSATANQVSTFAISPPTLTGYQVAAIAVTARAKCGAAGPQNLQLALRVSGTNYFSGSKVLDVGYGAFVNIWSTNPATSAAWVNTAVSSVQPGVKSIT